MIDYSKVKPGDKLRVTGMGAPGYANMGDIVTVTSCTADNNGRCEVVNEAGRVGVFVLTCGAQRLEPVVLATVAAVKRLGGHRVPEVEITLPFTDPEKRMDVLDAYREMMAWRGTDLRTGWYTHPTLVCFDIEPLTRKAVFKFSFASRADAVAFNEEFDPS